MNHCRAALAVLLMLGAGASQSSAGYLVPGAFDVVAVLPPAPLAGDPRDAADRAIYLATRKMVGTPRWAMATADVASEPADMMRDFSCAVGVALTPDDAPKLAALVAKAGADTAAQTNAAKRYYRRLRPFQIVDGPVCQSKQELATSFDYPSGHTTWGWTWATILAELAPDRAAPILARGRAYGESRTVCGAHYDSAVEAAFVSASATMAAVRAQPRYRADLEKARGELAKLRRDPATPKPRGCDAEAKLVARHIF